jgi:hypothetical protein
MDTFIAKLPDNWSEYFSTMMLEQYIKVYGKKDALTKVKEYIAVQDNLKLSLEAEKKRLAATTIYYNKQPEVKLVLGKGKKVAKKVMLW